MNESSKNKILVFEKNRLKVIQEVHDQSVVEYSKVRRILNQIKRFFYWSKMRNIIKRYIRNCHICKRAKSSRNDYSELLNLIVSSSQFWTNITLDFVNELKDKNAIVLIVTDRLTKQHHFISCSSDDEETTTDEIAKMLIANVWKLHDLSKTIIFDRESQFVSLI
jgi:hypothetical protein